MNILFLRGFNNYFNRTLKKYSTLQDYKDNSASFLDFSNINFNPNDGVVTELIVGGVNQLENNNPLAWEDMGAPDYAICYEQNEIKFRWYVLESERTRTGQYRIALKRDVIADNFDEIQYAPCFVEKGMIADRSNPLIYNKENMIFNQIKKRERLLSDESKTPWVVVYFPRDFAGGAVNASIPYNGTENISVNGITNWSWWNYTDNANANNVYSHHIPTEIVSTWRKNGSYHWKTGQNEGDKTLINFGDFNWKVDSDNTSVQTGSTLPPNINIEISNKVSPDFQSATTESNTTKKSEFDERFWYDFNFNNSSFNNAINTATGLSNRAGFLAQSEYNSLKELNNKVLKDTSSGKYYKISVLYGEEVTGIQISSNQVYNSKSLTTTNAFNTFWAKYSEIGAYIPIDPLTPVIPAVPAVPSLTSFKTKQVWIHLEEQINAVTMTIPAANARYHLQDQPYDMLCIPYYDIDIYKNGAFKCKANGIAAINIASQLAVDLGSQAIYDVQLLPFCPIGNIISDYKKIDYGNVFASEIKDPDENILNVAFYCSSSEFSFDINYNENIRKYYTKRLMSETFSTNNPNNNNNYQEIPPYLDPLKERFLITFDIRNLTTDNFFDFYNKNINDIRNVNISNFKINNDSTLIIKSIDDERSTSFYPDEILVSYYDNYDICISIDYGLIPTWLYDYAEANTSTSSSENLVKVIGQGSFNVEFEVTDEILNRKIANECDLWRLCSPNWNGQFDFNIAKMNGQLTGFHVDCSYKPFQPYIHIVPKFSGLYGNYLFNGQADARGLICGGDFSLPQLSNAWSNYVLQNKNYQNMFDREMLSLEKSQQIQKEQQILNSITGAVGSSVNGAMTGFLASGNPIGAAVGGIVGGAAGGVGAALDYDWLERQQEESKSFKTDMYNYNLGNIQAIPTSITKVSTYNPNNKIFPVLEFYTCTDEEKEILKNKVIYDGMTIMAIGDINTYSKSKNDKTFVRGDLIRLDGLADDFHTADTIYQEVKKGFYITQ